MMMKMPTGGKWLAATAALVVVMGCCAEALPYRDMILRPSQNVDQEEDARELAPLARQVDLWRMLLSNAAQQRPEQQMEVGEGEEDVSRHLALMERRRRILAQNNLLAQRQPDLRLKRRGSCMFHAGLAHNCDFRDVVGAVNEASHWGSELAPGKRRR